MINYDYAFSVAKIRSLEKKLVTKNQLERILDSEKLNGFFEALNDTAYSKHFLAKNDPYDFQKIINQELLETKKTLLKITPFPKELDWLWFKYDFSNLKYLIKSKLANTLYDEEIINQLSSFDANDIISYLDKKNSNKINPEYKKIIDQIMSIENIQNKPEEIDNFLDKVYFKKLSKTKKSIKNENIKKFINCKIDLFNLKHILRSKILKKNLDYIKKNIVVSGNIDINDLYLLYNKNYSDFARHPKLLDYKNILNLSIEYLEQYQSLSMFEKLSYEYMIELLWKFRLENLSPVPLVSFWLAKDNEAKMLRIIMIGKLNSISHTDIRLKLNKLYLEK